jgi:superfamily I DNA/RNA helicase
MKQKPWFDVLTFSISTRSYYRSLLMHGVKVDDVPKIKVATIHGAKGGQADNVAIITDCWRQSYQDQYSDDEKRIKYVAVTRTKSALFLIQPSTLKEYVFK